ncbi:purine-nucleoside phosphorylase [Rhizobiaceae bacterium]|nr:purine-nucleoside phosphorylase [Rhizobiaceae bacterium]
MSAPRSTSKTARKTDLKTALDGFVPDIAMVLGSGLGGLVELVEDARSFPYAELDGFPVSGVSGHAGTLTVGTIGANRVALMAGRAHYYEKGDAAAMRGALTALRDASCERLVFTNAAGSCRKKAGPGSVMQITDHINFSGTNPLIGETTDDRFVGMTGAYDKDLAKRFRKAAKALDIKMKHGTYMWWSGPSFETPAEVRMSRRMGADAVGMSTVPEVILARFLGLRVAAFSVITNFGAGITGAELSHHETKELAPKGGRKLAQIIAAALEKPLP